MSETKIVETRVGPHDVKRRLVQVPAPKPPAPKPASAHVPKAK